MGRRLDARRWAQDNRAENGSLPSGRDIGIKYGRHEWWGGWSSTPARPATSARESVGNMLAS